MPRKPRWFCRARSRCPVDHAYKQVLIDAGRRRIPGFTLLELLVVIVIIGLLVGYVAPRYFSQVGKSEVQVTKAQIDALEKALDTSAGSSRRVHCSDGRGRNGIGAQRGKFANRAKTAACGYLAFSFS